jgi:type II secretory pathway component GspD/PulD (secretin)
VLEVRYSERDGIEVSGTPAELDAVRRAVSALGRTGGGQTAFKTSRAADPAPYDRVLKRLVVAVGRRAAKISLAGPEEMRVEGSPESLEAFASYFDFEPGAAAGNHAHFENYLGESDRWVSAGSIPLVISVR